MFRKLIIIITFTSIFIEGVLVAHAQDLNMVIPISMLLLMSVLAYIILTGMVIYLTEKEVVVVEKEINVYEPPIEVAANKLVEDLFEEKGVAQVDIGIDTSSEDVEIAEIEEDDIIGIIEIGAHPHTDIIEIDYGLLKEKAINIDLDIDLEKIMLETDCPFLTPEPFRGKRNEPIYVKYIAKRIAEIKNLTEERVAEITTANARKFFKI